MTIFNRRAMLAASGAAWAAPAFAAWPLAGAGMPREAADTPHICLGPIADAEINPAGIRRYTQLGLTHIILNGADFPWNADTLKAKVKILSDNGLTVGDVGLPWSGPGGSFMRDIIYARPGRDKAIEQVKQSIRAAGAAGIPIVEYNFYVHRANEGYYDHPDPARGNAMIESFDFARMKDANCDLIVVGGIVRDSVQIISAIRKIGWNVDMMGQAASYDEVVATVPGGATEGFYSMTPMLYVAQDPTTPDQKAFADDYKKLYGKEPNFAAQIGYTGAQVTVQALKNAGKDLTADSFVAGMEAIKDYRDIFGSPVISFSPTKHQGSNQSFLCVVKDGKWQVAEPEPLGY